MNLPDGVPQQADYLALLSTEFFRNMAKYSDSFFSEHRDLLETYRWVKNPLRQWSRQWEYPFVLQALRNFARGHRTPCVLDAGAGITFFPYYVANCLRKATVVCCDSDPTLIGLYRDVTAARLSSPCKVRFDHADLTNLPYESGTFDAVYCVSVLEHVSARRQALTELARVVRVGGVLVLTLDIGLDGVSDIAPHEAESLVVDIAENLQDAASPLMLNLARGNIVTTEFCGGLDPELLPWRFPRLSLFKAALHRRRFPRAASKRLTVYCRTFSKQDESRA